MAGLQEMVDKTISLVTNDGRNIVGTLRGHDQCVNVILADCHERVFSSSKPVEVVELGLFVVRGDNIAIVGLLDDEADGALDFNNIRADPIKSVVH